MDSWTQPDFLQNSGQDYLASLASFLDGKTDIAVPPSHILGTQPQEPSSPELTDSASPASSNGLDSTTTQLMQSRQHGQQHARAMQQAQHHPDKRKNGTQGAGAIKDSRRTSGGHHSHPTGEDGEISRSESPEDDGSRGAPGKGNKTKTSEKRRAQNRQAQRNFRERKEKHLKDLEERVKLLEQQTNERDAENAALKQLLESLRSENDRLKVYESAFTFDYNKDVDGSSAMPQAATFNPPPSLPSTSASSPASSLPSSVPPADDLNASTSSFKFDTSGILSSSAGPAFTLPSSTSTPPATSNIPTTTAAQFDDFLSSFVASPSPGASGSSISSLPTPPSATASGSGSGDLFTAYRDPLASLGMQPTSLSTFNDFDNLFSSIPPPPPAASSNSLSPEDPLIAQFINASPSPPSAIAGTTFPSPGAAFFTGNLAPKSPPSLSPSSDSQCPEGLKARAAAALAAGGKFEFDLDGLCSEMKAKATCQEAARRALMSAMAEDAAASRQAYPQQL